MKVVTSDDLKKEAQYLRLCIYGEPGTGKTWFGASGALDPLTAPVLFLEYRAQIASVRSNPEFIRAMDDKRLVIISLSKYDELTAIYNWLHNGFGISPEADALFNEPPKSVVIDSLTELQRSEVMRIAGNTPDVFRVELERPEIQHWNSLLNQFTLLAHLFYKLPYHIVFVGLESVDYGPHNIGETPPITGYRLALQGQAQRQFPAYALTLMRLDRAPINLGVHSVGYTFSVISKTKEQTGMIPAKIKGPTLPKLVKMLRGDEKEEKDEQTA